MQPDTRANAPQNSHLGSLWRIARKEMTIFFASPLAYLFLAGFVGASLFVVFWGEAFFARNIADVRPLFEWMPIVLIFLCSALTMRMWSEERRTGTLEFVMTVPVPTWHFVAGKFLACITLLAIALLLTLILPLSVSVIATLDWGPIWAAYLATLLLGAAYLAIGLFVSARSDNQIVSLMLSCLVCGVFYFLGSRLLLNLFDHETAELLSRLGTGSRFESITRGVIDIRDLYYYASLCAAFLCLNIFALERQRWARDGDRQYHRAWRGATALVVLNLVAANFWLNPITALRADVTEGRIFSISDATRGYLQQLREPLLIRGYFSAKTHPLLAPLVPQIRDLLKEYEIAGRGNVRTEFVDPVENPELEEEAYSKYGIQATPFQVSDRYQAALVNSYFNVVVQYGDEHEVLGFRDLIEVKASGESDIDVKLRNPEYDITRSIKKVLYSYQSSGNLFDNLEREVTFTGYFSADRQLPPQLAEFKETLQGTLEKLQAESGNRLQFEFKDPQAEGGELARQIAEEFGFRPMAASLFDSNTFYFYMTLADGEQVVQLPLPNTFDETAFSNTLEAGLKRFASGFMKTLGLVVPQANPYAGPHGMGGGGGKQFNQLQTLLAEGYSVRNPDLGEGVVPGDIDLLLLVSPENLSDTERFALDQYLMQGGTVVLASSSYSTNMTRNSLTARAHTSGLEEWLRHHGIGIEKTLVMDRQNAAFPIPVTRHLGGIPIQEMRMFDYPYFVDIRSDGMNLSLPVTADLPQVTLAWPSPLTVDGEKNSGRQVVELLHSSENAWTSTDTDILPKTNGSFTPGAELSQRLLAVAVSGEFTSYYSGKTSPLLELEKAEKEAAAEETEGESAQSENESENEAGVISSVIDKSAESARLIVFASNDFLADQILQMAGVATGTEYTNPLQLVHNAVEWSLEDSGLLSIRSRGHFSRTLPPMERDAQVFWESANYVLALLGVIAVYLIQRWRRAVRHNQYSAMLAEGV